MAVVLLAGHLASGKTTLCNKLPEKYISEDTLNPDYDLGSTDVVVNKHIQMLHRVQDGKVHELDFAHSALVELCLSNDPHYLMLISNTYRDAISNYRKLHPNIKFEVWVVDVSYDRFVSQFSARGQEFDVMHHDIFCNRLYFNMYKKHLARFYSSCSIPVKYITDQSDVLSMLSEVEVKDEVL